MDSENVLLICATICIISLSIAGTTCRKNSVKAAQVVRIKAIQNGCMVLRGNGLQVICRLKEQK